MRLNWFELGVIQRNVFEMPTGCTGFFLLFILSWLNPAVLKIVSSQTPTESRLLLVFTLSRHGDRSPANALAGDPYGTHWLAGYGQLTELGAAQHMELGQFVRDRYGSFIPQTYHKDECFFRSSGMHRTLQSASSFLMGLYQTPLQKNHIIPPVFSTPESDDHLLVMSQNCPRYMEHLHSLLRSPTVMEKMNSFATTVDTLRKNFPKMFSESDLTPSSQLPPTWKICDHVRIWAAHNLSHRPLWITDQIVHECQALLDYKMYLDYSTPIVRRFRGGPLVAHVIRLFRDRANEELGTQRTTHSLLPEPLGTNLLPVNENNQDLNHQRRRRLIAYFAHDSTLAAFMSHLGVFNGYQPPLASCLFIELHRLPRLEDPSEEQFFLRFVYRNSSLPNPRPPVPIWPPACGPIEQALQMDYFCSLSRMESAMWGTYVLHDQMDECNPTKSTHSSLVNDDNITLGSVDRYYIPLLLIILCQFFLLFYLVVRLNLRVFRPYDRSQA